MLRTMTEMPHLSTRITIPTAPTAVYKRGRIVEVDHIDVRLEDVNAYGNPHPKYVDPYGWAGELPHMPGQFLTHDHGIVSADEVAALKLRLLPPDWWEYAAGTFRGQTVKAPKHHREPNERSQEWIDLHGPEGRADESYERRLSRALFE